MPTYKAIELDLRSKRRTGRQYELVATTRQAAVVETLSLLGAIAESALIDPSRTLLQVGNQLWTIVGVTDASAASESAALRRAGAKHKRVR